MKHIWEQLQLCLIYDNSRIQFLHEISKTKSFNPRKLRAATRRERRGFTRVHSACFLLLWVIISKSVGKRGARCSEFARAYSTPTPRREVKFAIYCFVFDRSELWRKIEFGCKKVRSPINLRTLAALSPLPIRSSVLNWNINNERNIIIDYARNVLLIAFPCLFRCPYNVASGSVIAGDIPDATLTKSPADKRRCAPFKVARLITRTKRLCVRA